MKPATWPVDHPLQQRLLLLHPDTAAITDHVVADLPWLLRAGDLLVVNDSATLPASLRARTQDGAAVEVRLLAQQQDGAWTALLFGAGDWRTPTEHRSPAPTLRAGELLTLTVGVDLEVLGHSALSPRLVRLRFVAGLDATWQAIYQAGAPIQYSYVRDTLPLWHVQNVYASRPWSVELPSAGHALNFELLGALRARGVELAWLTHAAGISSTGEDVLDALLPLPERYELPQATVDAVTRARGAGRRVVAVGTSVVRALEGNWRDNGGALRAGGHETALKLGPGFVPGVVDGLFTGMHEPTASHYALLQAFAPLQQLRGAYQHAVGQGYLGHEFGDTSLILKAA